MKDPVFMTFKEKKMTDHTWIIFLTPIISADEHTFER